MPRVACAHCGEFFTLEFGKNTVGNAPNCCPLCRDEIIELMKSYSPSEREAYIRGRLAAARDNNDYDMIRAIGALLDKLRIDAVY